MAIPMSPNGNEPAVKKTAPPAASDAPVKRFVAPKVNREESLSQAVDWGEVSEVDAPTQFMSSLSSLPSGVDQNRWVYLKLNVNPAEWGASHRAYNQINRMYLVTKDNHPDIPAHHFDAVTGFYRMKDQYLWCTPRKNWMEFQRNLREQRNAAAHDLMTEPENLPASETGEAVQTKVAGFGRPVG